MSAAGINKRNPYLQLPEHEPAGDWLVTYDLGDTLTIQPGLFCTDDCCRYDADCIQLSHGSCRHCHLYCVDNECHETFGNAIGICHLLCKRAVDTLKEDNETDAAYYQRMDKLHWG
jgi:hypothetical protein